MCAMVLVISVVSVAFETATNALRVHAKKKSASCLELVRTLTKEIMNVGVIAFALTVLIQAGHMQEYSDLAFLGKESEHQHGIHDIRQGHRISELTVLFQDVHFLLFCIVLALIALGGFNLVVEARIIRQWQAADALAEELGGIAAYEKLGEQKGWKRYWIERQRTYLRFRAEFLYPSQGSRPARVDPDQFNYLEYVHMCMGDAIVGGIHCPKWVYLFYFFVGLLLTPLVGYSARGMVRSLGMMACVIALAFGIIVSKLQWIEAQILPQQRSILNEKGSGLRLVLHETLFWFGPNGAAFLARTSQVLQFGIAVLVAGTVQHAFTTPYTWRANVHWAAPLLGLPILLTLFYLFPESLIAYTFLTNTEQMPNSRVIQKVNLKHAKDKKKFWLHVLGNLKRERSHTYVAAQGLAALEAAFEDLPESRKAMLSCFHTHADVDGPHHGMSREDTAYFLREEHMADVDGWFLRLGFEHHKVLPLAGFKALLASLEHFSSVLEEMSLLEIMQRDAPGNPDQLSLTPALVEKTLEKMAEKGKAKKDKTELGHVKTYRGLGKDVVHSVLHTEAVLASSERVVETDARISARMLAGHLARMDRSLHQHH